MALFGLGNKMSSGDMIILTTSLSYMLSAGLTARDGVDIIMQDPSSKMNKRGLQIMHDGFNDGQVLSQILKDNEAVFGIGLWQQVDAAERTGKVPEALLRISEQLKANRGIVSKIKGALAYPIFILVVAAIAAIYLFTHTIPEMGQMMEDLGGEMPAITLSMMSIADMMVNHGVVMLAIFLIFCVIVQWALTHPFRKGWHRVISRAPLSGQISVNLSYSRMYMMVNDMVANGSPMVESLRVAASTIDNLFISGELKHCADVMEREGYVIAEALQGASSMPSDDKLMLGVGQRTGREMEILEDLSKRRSAAAAQSVERLLEMMTPIIMVVVCGVVAVLVIAVYLPMLTMASTMGG